MGKPATDTYIPEPSPAIVILYDRDDWESPLAEFYRKNPNLQYKVSIILLPRGGFNPFK